MEKQLQLILTVWIVNFELTLVQPDNQIASQFQNFFDSIMKKNTKKSESYSEILKEEVLRKRQAFDAMKEELQMVRNQNANRMKNFYENSYISGNVVVTKRETEENNLKISEATRKADLREQEILKNLSIRYKAICLDLIEINVDSFMEKSLATFDHLCESMSFSCYLGYRNVYNDILATRFVDFNKGSTQFWTGVKPGLIAKNNETTFLLEFVVGRSASYAMAEIEKYKNNFHGSGTDVLCMGINFHYDRMPMGARQLNASMIDKLRCDYEAKLYSETEELKKTFPRKELALDCP